MSEQATVAGGCFWCLEAVFDRLAGVSRGVGVHRWQHRPSESYHDVCSGTTGHAEARQITFDPGVISYEELLEILFAFHDPTTSIARGRIKARSTAPPSSITTPRRETPRSGLWSGYERRLRSADRDGAAAA